MKVNVLKPIPKSVETPPTFWQTSETTTSIQVHNANDAKTVVRELEGRRIAYSINGERLEVFEVRRTVPWVERRLKELLPSARRVWGCELDETALP